MARLVRNALTYEDFLRFPDDGNRYEIIGGEMYVSKAPNLRHQRISRDLGFAIQTHLRRTGEGELLHAPLAVILSPHDIFVPDLVVVLPERASILRADAIHGAPNLVIEIVSRSTEGRDRGIKRDAYDRFGVEEYWIVDPDDDRIEVHARAKGKLELACDVGRGESFQSPVLAGLTVAVDEILG